MVKGPAIIGCAGTNASVSLGVPTSNIDVCAFFHCHTMMLSNKKHKDMKYLVLFLMSMFPLLSISAQNLEKMDSVQRNKYLIDLSSEVIKTMGPGYYRNTHPTISEGVFKSNDGRAKIKKNIGRKYYEIKYPYDKSKETLEFDFSAKVRIWKDTGEPCDVIFGNGYGKNFFFSSYKEQTKSRTATDKVPYQQVQNANKNIGTK